MDLRRIGGTALARHSSPARAEHTETHTPYYELAERVDLVRHARAMGLENLPDRSAVTPNDVECAIEHEFRNRHRAALEAARSDLHGLTEEFTKLEDRLPSVGGLEVAPAAAAADLERELAVDRSVANARRELQARCRDERAFRHRLRLDREARYPSSRLLHLGVVGLLVLIESVLNMGFFAASSALGLLGGFLVAVGVSLANAGSGLVAGFLAFRHLHARSPWLRAAAAFSAAAYVAGAVVFNLAVAHFRDLGSGQDAAGAALVDALRQPLGMSTVSAGLFILGVVVSAVAVWHGYTLDDPCPGYGEVVRARRRAAEGSAEAEQSLRSRALAHVEAVPGRCEELVRQARERVHRLIELSAEARRRIDHYETERAHHQHWCTVLLRRYRCENEAVRTAPPPAYFGVYPEIPPELDGAVATDLAARVERARAALEGLAAQSHATASAQPARVARARQQLDGFVAGAVRRADAARGDGTESPGTTADEVAP